MDWNAGLTYQCVDASLLLNSWELRGVARLNNFTVIFIRLINDVLLCKGQNPLHQFPRSKSVTSWREQKSVVSDVSCRFPNSITTTCKLQSLLSQERLKLRTANLADTFTGSIRRPWKILEKSERGHIWHIQGMPNFFEYPLLSPNFWSIPYYLRSG